MSILEAKSSLRSLAATLRPVGGTQPCEVIFLCCRRAYAWSMIVWCNPGTLNHPNLEIRDSGLAAEAEKIVGRSDPELGHASAPATQHGRARRRMLESSSSSHDADDAAASCWAVSNGKSASAAPQATVPAAASDPAIDVPRVESAAAHYPATLPAIFGAELAVEDPVATEPAVEDVDNGALAVPEVVAADAVSADTEVEELSAAMPAATEQTETDNDDSATLDPPQGTSIIDAIVRLARLAYARCNVFADVVALGCTRLGRSDCLHGCDRRSARQADGIDQDHWRSAFSSPEQCQPAFYGGQFGWATCFACPLRGSSSAGCSGQPTCLRERRPCRSVETGHVSDGSRVILGGQ